MKILLVSQYFWPEPFAVNELAEAWSADGHEVHVLTGLPNYPGGRLFPGYSWLGPYRQSRMGADIRRVPLLTRGPRRGLRLILNYLSFAVAATLAGPLVARVSPDVIFVYVPSPILACIPALWIARLRRAPVALWIQDLWPDNLSATGAVRSPALLRMAGAVSRAIYRRADLVLVQSPAFVDAVRRVCPEVGPLRVLVNWADPRYRPEVVAADAPERREMPDGFRIVYAGNLGSAQGLGVVLDAAEILHDLPIRWVFIGEGNDRARLEAECRRRGLDRLVTFLGWRAPETMPHYLALADVLLVSLRRADGFASTVPTKVQSGLAAGRPLLAALEGEGARIVKEAGAGLVVTPEDARALADGARTLFEAGGDALAEMGRHGRAYAVQHFDRDVLVAQLNHWLHDLAGRRA